MVIGLQEFAPLSLKTAMLGPGEERVKKWDLIISSHLEKLDPKAKYLKFHSKVMMGLAIFLYGKKDIVEWMSNIQASKVKTGFKGAGENKGAVILR